MFALLLLVLGLFGSVYPRSGLTRMTRSGEEQDQTITPAGKDKRAPNFGFGEIARPRMGKRMWNVLVESSPADFYREEHDMIAEESKNGLNHWNPRMGKRMYDNGTQ